MENDTQYYFLLLKEQLIAACQRVYPHIPTDMQLWKGADIACFQDLLEEKTQGRISEKSFYNYFKSGTKDKLPREDVLDLFAKMVGSESWRDFVANNKPVVATPVFVSAATPPVTHKRFPAYYWILLVGIGILITSAAVYKSAFAADAHAKIKVSVCFKDAFTQRAIQKTHLTLRPIATQAQPQTVIVSDSMGCMHWESEKGTFQYVVQSPYYQADTLTIEVKKGMGTKDIFLNPDDYAMIIRYFSEGKMEDYDRQVKKLSAIFADEAEIVQIEEETGYIMEIFNKEEFILKLSAPFSSLKHIEVTQTSYNKQKQIVGLRFVQQDAD